MSTFITASLVRNSKDVFKTLSIAKKSLKEGEDQILVSDSFIESYQMALNDISGVQMDNLSKNELTYRGVRLVTKDSKSNFRYKTIACDFCGSVHLKGYKRCNSCGAPENKL